MTRKIASDIARGFIGGEVVSLRGGLGAGKTVFAKGIAEGLGVTEPVLSPTFTIIKQYRSGRLTLNHLDLYRIGADECDELGIEELLDGSGVTLIEWAENVPKLLPECTIEIKIIPTDEDTRQIIITENFSG